MAKFTEKSFGRMRFNPLTAKKLLAEYEDLKQIVHEGYEKDPNLDKILRFCIMMYDADSPVYKAEPDIKERRKVAGGLCNFPPGDFTDQVFSHSYKFGEVNGEEESGLQYIPQLVTDYLTRFSGSMEHAAIEALRFVYWESVFKMMEPINGKSSKEELESVQKKKIIADQLPVYAQSIKSQLLELYGGDEKLVEIQEIKTRFNPESIGDVLKNKER